MHVKGRTWGQSLYNVRHWLPWWYADQRIECKCDQFPHILLRGPQTVFRISPNLSCTCPANSHLGGIIFSLDVSSLTIGSNLQLILCLLISYLLPSPLLSSSHISSADLSSCQLVSPHLTLTQALRCDLRRLGCKSTQYATASEIAAPKPNFGAKARKNAVEALIQRNLQRRIASPKIELEDGLPEGVAEHVPGHIYVGQYCGDIAKRLCGKLSAGVTTKGDNKR